MSINKGYFNKYVTDVTKTISSHMCACTHTHTHAHKTLFPQIKLLFP